MQVHLLAPGEDMKTAVAGKYREFIEAGIAPGNILVLAPGREAASAAREEIKGLFPRGHGELWVETGPGFCSKLLRRLPAGISRQLQVVTGWQRYVLFEEAAREVELQSVFRHTGRRRSFILWALNIIEILQASGTGPGHFQQWAAQNGNPKFTDLAAIYDRYEDLCRRTGYYTPPGLARLLAEKLQGDPGLARFLGDKFRQVIIAGAGEMDPVYLEITRLLASGGAARTVFLDAAGCLLASPGPGSWDPLRHFGVSREAAEARLQEYRAGIPGVVSRFIVPGKGPGPGEDTGVVLVRAEKAAGESARAAEKIRELLDRGVAPEDCIILYRDLDYHPDLPELLARHGIPFQLDAGAALYRDPQVEFIAAMLDFLQHPAGGDRLCTLLLSPVIAVDPYTCRHWMREAGQEGRELLDYIRDKLPELPGEQQHPVRQVLDMAGQGPGSAGETVGEICRRFGLYKAAAQSEDAAGALRRLQAVLDAARFVDSVRSFRGGSFTAGEFMDMWRQAGLQVTHGETEGSAPGVTVAQLRQAENLAGKYVLLLGAAGDILPAPRRPRYYLAASEVESLLAGAGPLKAEGALDAGHIYAQEQKFFLQALRAGREKVYISFAGEYPGLPAAVPSPFIHGLLGHEEVSPENAARRGLGWEETGAGEAKSLDLPLYRFSREAARKALACRCREQGNDAGPETGLPPEEYEPGLFKSLPPEPVYFNGDVNLSASALKDYLNCPRQFFFQKLLRLEDEGSPHMEFGSLVHRVLELFHGQYPSLEGGGAPEEDLEKILEGMRPEFRFSHTLVAEGQFRRAREMLRAYLEQVQQYWEKGREVVRREHSFKWKGDGFVVRGKIDRLDRLPCGGYEVIDYKTGRAENYKQLRRKFMPAGKEEYHPEDLQLPVYYWALQELEPGLDIDYLTYYYLKDGPEPRRFYLADGGTGQDELCPRQLNGPVRDKFYEIVSRIREGYFPAQPVSCYFCSFGTFCENSEVSGSE